MNIYVQYGLLLLIPAALALGGALLLRHWKNINKRTTDSIVWLNRYFVSQGFPHVPASDAVREHSEEISEIYEKNQGALMFAGFATLAIATSLIAYGLILNAS